MKKSTIIIFLLILAIFGAVVFVNKNKKEVAISVPVPITTDTQKSTTTAPKKEVVSTPGVILTGNRAKYENLSEEERKIIDRYTEKYPAIYKEILAGSGNEIAAKNTFPLKYHDDKTAVIADFNDKVGQNLIIYNIATFEKLNKDEMFLFGNYVESRNYIVATINAIDGEFIFYKNGATDFQKIPSSLLKSKNETYMKQGGFGGVYDFSLDDTTKTLTASVFKPVFREGQNNPKIRTATFILP